MRWRANLDEDTTNWRAVCGRTARTVRRAGTVWPFPTTIEDESFRRGDDLNDKPTG